MQCRPRFFGSRGWLGIKPSRSRDGPRSGFGRRGCALAGRAGQVALLDVHPTDQVALEGVDVPDRLIDEHLTCERADDLVNRDLHPAVGAE
jgi:hypothetical protein